MCIRDRYNSGAERTATVHLVYDGAAYPITVTQGACEFAYGEPRVEGNLFRNIESTATLRLDVYKRQVHYARTMKHLCQRLKKN